MSDTCIHLVAKNLLAWVAIGLYKYSNYAQKQKRLKWTYNCENSDVACI